MDLNALHISLIKDYCAQPEGGNLQDMVTGFGRLTDPDHIADRAVRVQAALDELIAANYIRLDGKACRLLDAGLAVAANCDKWAKYWREYYDRLDAERARNSKGGNA